MSEVSLTQLGEAWAIYDQERARHQRRAWTARRDGAHGDAMRKLVARSVAVAGPTGDWHDVLRACLGAHLAREDVRRYDWAPLLALQPEVAPAPAPDRRVRSRPSRTDELAAMERLAREMAPTGESPQTGEAS